ncbi:MAG TPA: hypothetical protein VGX96_00670 [Candidatus Elarobacter sp.]|jgi:hypothetical protein|nr:hypothetical protein [Candidatus Elarobacter sp.]
MFRRLLAGTVLAVVLPPGMAHAVALAPADRVEIRRAATPLPLDPALTDPRWTDGALTGPFLDMGSKTPAGVATSVSLWYDDRALYVGVRAEQKAPLVATQATDDVGYGTDDFVGVSLDVTGNGGRTYLFVVTPRGTRYAFANETARFRPEWSAAAKATPEGWNAVLKIPYKALKLAADGPQKWRINIVRNVASTAEHETLAYDALMSYQTIPNWPDIGRDWRWWPSVRGVTLSGAVPRPKPRAEAFLLESTGNDRDAFTVPSGATVRRAPRTTGADIAIPIDATTTFVGALSPDFSNVEVDQQTIAPQQFRRAFTEYRPFFAQGAPYINPALEGYEFNLPNEVLFYSPAIGPFDRGLKLVGTKGTNSFGALEVRGSNPQTGAVFDDVAFGFKHRRPDNTFGYWIDGVNAAHSNGLDRSWEAGAFGRSLASGLVYSAMHAQETGTFVSRAGDAQKNAAFVDIQKPGMEAAVVWLDIGPSYSPVDGFTNIADVRGPELSLDLTRSPKRGPVKNAELYLYWDRWLDRQGNVHESDADAYLSLRMRSKLALYFNTQNGSQRTYEGDYFSGGTHGYRDQQLLPFKTWSAGFGYGEGTPNSIRTDYQAGPFGPFQLHQTTTTLTRALGSASVSFDYAGTREGAYSGFSDGQWLRRVSVAVPFGRDGNASIAYRDVSGRGGFATPGRNLAASFRRRFANGNELFVNYGTPAATSTLDRVIVKYLVRLGGGV